MPLNSMPCRLYSLKHLNPLLPLPPSWSFLPQAEEERAISDMLLNSMVPPRIAVQLKALRWWEITDSSCVTSIADSYPDVTVLFTDLVGFTKLSSRITPEAAMRHLNSMYSVFDEICEKYGLYKVGEGVRG